MSDDHVMRGDANRKATDEARPETSSVPSDVLIIVPVRDAVVFPGTVFPIALDSERSVKAAQQALREQRPIGVLMQRDAEGREPSPADLHRVGTVANMLRYVNAPNGGHHVALQGVQRFRVTDFAQEQPFFGAHVALIDVPEEVASPEAEARTIH